MTMFDVINLASNLNDKSESLMDFIKALEDEKEEKENVNV